MSFSSFIRYLLPAALCLCPSYLRAGPFIDASSCEGSFTFAPVSLPNIRNAPVHKEEAPSLNNLMYQAQLGDHSAFEALVKLVKPGLERLCVRLMGHYEDGIELAQEVILIMWEKRMQCSNSLTGWMRTIASRRAVYKFKTQKRLVSLDRPVAASQNLPLADFIEGKESEAFEGLLAAERKAMVWAAVSRLPIHLMDTALLFYVEQKRVLEIAELQRIPVGTVQRRLFQARESLRKHLLPNLGDD